MPRRYDASALEKFNVSAHPGCFYGSGCAGITLDFFTDAPEISFRCSAVNELSYGRMEYSDVWEEGVFTQAIEWDGFAVHGGIGLSPNARIALMDHCHPGDRGFLLCTRNLLKELL